MDLFESSVLAAETLTVPSVDNYSQFALYITVTIFSMAEEYKRDALPIFQDQI